MDDDETRVHGIATPPALQFSAAAMAFSDAPIKKRHYTSKPTTKLTRDNRNGRTCRKGQKYEMNF